MAGYTERVAADLDRWVAAGLVPAESRGAILATLPARRRVDAVTALIWVAAVLLGLAVIAFIAANWEGIPRLVRFGLLLAGFAAAAAGGAEMVRRRRRLGSDVLLTIASLVFASAVGLTGQIFEITGNPPAVPYGAGAAALALGLAGASRGALAIGVVGILIGDLITHDGSWPVPISLVVAPAALIIALRWRSGFLAHVSSVAVLGVGLWFAIHYELVGWPLFGIAAAFALLAFSPMALTGRRGSDRDVIAPLHLLRIPVTWFVLGALGFFIAAGYSGAFSGHIALGLTHRVVWIAVSAGLIAYGRYDRQSVLTAIGVVSLIVAVCAVLNDLGLDLIVISLVFLACSIVALVVGLALRRDRAPKRATPAESSEPEAVA
ncbi:MAG: DUF2157 domain-containing protein [Gordonia sp. (in: high G+C Gram-positive bacteria)]|uniref:DUF2157 domain-containing protein n=1 Tax=Gordonia sp. (in: high G+C Gram-positive bacteria) TaxID=84139 RepID=UPI0039E47532